jgi:hypothetical protein
MTEDMLPHMDLQRADLRALPGLLSRVEERLLTTKPKA